MKVTREAAGVAVFSPDGRLLVGRHSHDGRWATIGGSVEAGESHHDAAAREAREEVGLVLESLRLLGNFADSPIYDVTYPDGTVTRYAVSMFAAVLDAAAQPMPDRQEILDVAWVTRDDVEGMDIAPDMAEIIPAAFAWFDANGRDDRTVETP